MKNYYYKVDRVFAGKCYKLRFVILHLIETTLGFFTI